MLNSSMRSSSVGSERFKSNFSAQTKLLKKATLTIFLALFAGCSYQKYQSKPIDPSASSTKLELKDPAGGSFQTYLLSNGYTADRLPLQIWGLDDLTYCALFFHPSLDVARAQWRAAKSSELIAGERPLPTVNGNIAHSNDPDPTKKPFTLGLSIDIPIETASKRDVRIESAQHLSQAAKLEIAQAAWQLRDNIAQTLTEYQFNQAELALLNEEQSRRQEIVNIMQKRVTLGAASNIELSNVKLQLQMASTALHTAENNKLVLLSKLASNIGLPLTKLETMPLELDNKRESHEIPNKEVLTTALLNRIDIRIALERYAAAEAKLKLEIAKQYPDLVISPGAAFEFGDNIWSLGLSSLLSLLNKNKLGIADATQLREVEAAQFEALQTKVILDATTANTQVNQAKHDVENQKRTLVEQQAYTQRMQNKFNAGEIDRLEMAFANIENIVAKKNMALANYQLNKSLNQLENTLQKPLVADSQKHFSISDTANKIESE